MLVFTSCQKQAKIGFIDNGEVINNCQEKKDIEEKYKKLDEKFQRKRDSLSSALDLEFKEFQVKSKTMRQEEAQQKYDEIGLKQQRIIQQLQYDQQQLQQQFSVEIDSLIVKVKSFVEDYGKKNQYTYILGTSEASNSVLYGTDENNLSEEILTELDKVYKDKE